ncbi:MAG TPA: YsnF/AvaK domain-containing protein [Polyangiaceae bacterium]|nr:YsnF/AvaK domain-containing protein [Polyangiaceae bacterium]
MRTVIGLFGDAGEARRAIDELQGLGYSAEKISVVTNVASQPSIEARKSMGLQNLNLADVGKVATAGPLRDVLIKGPGPGGALGAALQLLGLTPELADHYVSGVRHGETLESVTVDDKDSDRVLAVMRRRSAMPSAGEQTREETRAREASATKERETLAARERETAAAKEREASATKERETLAAREREAASAAAAATAASTSKKTNGHLLEMDDRDEERIIPVIREEMRVGRRTVERGGVRVSSSIVEKPVSEEIHLRETHVDIERRAVDRPLRADERAFVNDTIEMVEMADEPVVSKQARVVEEVVVRKHVEDHTTTIADQVRSTEIEFGKLRAFDPEESRRFFDGEGAGGSFESYLPAFQYGHELHQRKTSSDRWEDIEGGARDRWEQKNPGTWDKFKAAIQHAWSNARTK